MLAPHLFPPRADGTDPRAVPDLRHRPAVAEARQVRRLHRLLELSGMPLHAADLGARRRRRRGQRDAASSATTRNRPRGHAAHRPLRALCAARRRRSTARSRSARACRKGTDPADDRSRDGAEAAVAAARGRPASGDGEPILAGIGRFGPYVQHGKTYANLESGDDVLQHRAQPRGDADRREDRQGAARAASAAIPAARSATIPTRAGRSLVKNGRYGPYVTHDGVNATLPSDKTPETITLEEARGPDRRPRRAHRRLIGTAHQATQGQTRAPAAAAKPAKPRAKTPRKKTQTAAE